MIDGRLLLLGRTGVGKSSLVNFISGEERCETDPYRACTKQTKEITIDRGNRIYELIDTPGLCEAGSDLDSYYLGLIDEYLRDKITSPTLVFKADDSRIRTEDYQLLKLLIERYGSRLFINNGLILTFAGNLGTRYEEKVHARVRHLTNAIYGIQSSLGMEIFAGFNLVHLIDSDLGDVFELEFPKNGIVSSDLHFAVHENDYSRISEKISVHPEMTDILVNNLLRATDNEGGSISDVIDRLNQFPFHSVKRPDDSISPTVERVMSRDPSNVFEVASQMQVDGFIVNRILIEQGALRYSTVFPLRKRLSADEFFDCVAVNGYATMTNNELEYSIHYAVIPHHYKSDGTADNDRILQEGQNAQSLTYVKTKSYLRFKVLVLSGATIMLTALQKMSESIEEDVSHLD